MNRHWAWSLVIAALFALHTHAWLHGHHELGDDLQSVESVCLACKIGQHDGPLGAGMVQLELLTLADPPPAQRSRQACDEPCAVRPPIRGPPSLLKLS